MKSGKRLRILTRKPFKEWTEKEKETLLPLLKSIVDKGGTVMLGDKRCFLCGKEINKDVAAYSLDGRIEDVKVISNLCVECFKYTEKYKHPSPLPPSSNSKPL